MFISHEKSPSKMKFQKPNILRRRVKVAAKSSLLSATTDMAVVNQPQIATKLPDWSAANFSKHKCSKPAHFMKKPVMQRIKLDSYVSEDNKIKMQEIDDKTSNARNDNVILNNNQEIGGLTRQMHTDFKLENCMFDIGEKTLEDFQHGQISYGNAEINWGLASVDNEKPNPLVQYVETEQCNGSDYSNAEGCVVTSNLQLDINSVVVTYLCDHADCNKEFATEAKLKKHKTTHTNATFLNKVLKQSIECPAGRGGGGPESACDKVFTVRADMLQHLKDEHTLEDALYSCPSCSRRFFWSGGLRSHARACEGGRAPLACAWPGCGRQFRQPCRLKEHARAHTGDKPYPCRFPNCGWSFRNASKLHRHARRHTGERRHRCDQCGRAFLRAEHLREHAARHERPPRPPRPSKHGRKKRDTVVMLDSQTTAEDTDGGDTAEAVFCLQLSKSEDLDDSACETERAVAPIVAPLAPSKIESDWSDGEDPFLMRPPSASTITLEPPSALEATSLEANPLEGGPLEACGSLEAGVSLEESGSFEEGVSLEACNSLEEAVSLEACGSLEEAVSLEACGSLSAWCEGEGRAARTHCTWPLAPRDDAVLVLEGDVQVELSQGAERKVYTIRSDLFLHGNILHSEDSESGVAVSAAATESAADAAGAAEQGAPLEDLGLLDAHTTIDLMQEELMYTDVNESSYHLLSDGDIQTFYTHAAPRR
ncbi:zinc finger protein GLI1 [Plutella xylostella]|uniref:zinc finger protein GLI1 n=1 Tax=Plutella xylostella TaxID=51655 RepID=UPI002032C8A4|nr:zinc finger protein GLI1 [Plutella xylostella]